MDKIDWVSLYSKFSLSGGKNSTQIYKKNVENSIQNKINHQQAKEIYSKISHDLLNSYVSNTSQTLIN